MKRVLVNTKDKWSKFDMFDYALVEDDGAIKWECNGHYLMDDTMEVIKENGFVDFSVEATRIKREAQVSEFVKNHKMIVSDEELAEMRNEFGEGAVIVDVISGEKIRL